MRRWLIVSLCSIIFSCSSGPVPKGIIPPEKMKKVVGEIMQVDEFINNYLTKDSAVDIKQRRSVLYEQTFKLNEITRRDFYSSFKYYQQHPNLQKALFDSVDSDMQKKPVELPKGKR